jgi:REP element-mobilizing transposase RayT
MPRPLRDFAPGIFHVTCHAVRSTELYRDEVDRVFFLTELARTVAQYEWTCMSVCEMTTHYHLLIETHDESLPLGMHRLNFNHARRFNARHRLRGHVLEKRYHSDRIESDAHLLAVYRYDANNPVKAGLCDAPQDWPWCSYGALFRPTDMYSFVDPTRVLECLGGSRAGALEKLRLLVEGVWLL